MTRNSITLQWPPLILQWSLPMGLFMHLYTHTLGHPRYFLLWTTFIYLPLCLWVCFPHLPPFCSVAKSCSTLCDSMDCNIPGFPVLHHLPEFVQTHAHESVMPSNYLILCRHLLFLSSIFPHIRVFSNESVLCIRWPKYWSFSFSTGSSNEYSGLIFSRMNRLGLLAVQGTLKSLLQHHSSKASVLWGSAFFIVQISYP